MRKKPHAKKHEREGKSPTPVGEKQEERHNCPFQHSQPHNPREGSGTLCLKIYLLPGLLRAAASSAKASELANTPLVHQIKMKLALSKRVTPFGWSWGTEKCRCCCWGTTGWLAQHYLFLYQKGGSHLITPLLADSLGCTPLSQTKPPSPGRTISVLVLHGECIFKASPPRLAGSGQRHWHPPRAAGIRQRLLGLSGLCSSLGMARLMEVSKSCR